MKQGLWMLAGAGLFAAGMMFAQTPGNEAMGQAVVGNGTMNKGPILITSSASGKQIHLWTLTGGEVIDPMIMPQRVKSFGVD